MRQQIPGLEGVATCFDYNESPQIRVPEAGKPDKVVEPHMALQEDWVTGIAIVGQDWFKVFRYQWLAGNPAAALNQPFTVVLTESAVKRYFSDLPPVDVMGRELVYAGLVAGSGFGRRERLDGTLRLLIYRLYFLANGQCQFPEAEAAFG